MIPKIIHYCWFGKGEKSKLILKCMKSWKKKCPDYQIIGWTENNFDINSHPFCKAAYEDNNWAFVSDFVRLYALYNYGGIYLDTDVEIIKNLDVFLKYSVFLGFEDGKHVANGLIFGSVKKHNFIKKLMNDYDSLIYCPNDINFRINNTNTERTTKILLEYGMTPNNHLQTISDITIFPQDYFCPLNVQTLEMHKTKNTYCIHHYEGSWTSERYKEWKKKQLIRNRIDKIRFFPQRMLRRTIGDERVDQLKQKLKNKSLI